MAEIKIKKKSPVWPWIILALIVLAAIAYYFITSTRVDMNDNRPHIGHDEQIENETGHNHLRLDGTKVLWPELVTKIIEC